MCISVQWLCMWTFPGVAGLMNGGYVLVHLVGANPRISAFLSQGLLAQTASRRFVKAPDVPQMVPSLKLTNRKGNSSSNPSVSGMLVSGRVYEFKREFERSLERLVFFFPDSLSLSLSLSLSPSLCIA